MISSSLSEAWKIYRERFAVIAAVVIAVWLPCELLGSYLEAFVFGRDDIMMSYLFQLLAQNFAGLLATAGVIFLAMAARLGQPATFGSAMRTGFHAWGRLWWTNFLSGMVVVLGFLLLIGPGIYLGTRLVFIEPVVVVERLRGAAAMRRSFELTRNRFAQTFCFGFAIGLTIMVPLALGLGAVALVPALNQWPINVLLRLLADVIEAFGAVAFLCGYQAFVSEPTNAAKAGGRCLTQTP